MRVILYVLCVVQAVNGLFMIVAPDLWYVSVPGVTATGAFNHHFVTDIGIAFLAAAVSLFAAAWVGHADTRLWPAAVFLGGHAAFHVMELAMHRASIDTALRDFVLIILPGFVPGFLILTQLRASKEILP